MTLRRAVSTAARCVVLRQLYAQALITILAGSGERGAKAQSCSVLYLETTSEGYTRLTRQAQSGWQFGARLDAQAAESLQVLRVAANRGTDCDSRAAYGRNVSRYSPT